MESSETPTSVPNADGELTFTFSEMDILNYFGCSYEIEKDGSIQMQFDGQWGQIVLALPQEIKLSDCEYVKLRQRVNRARWQ